MKNLQREIAAMESKLDYYETEFNQLNILLKKCGFPKGITTLKETAREILEDEFIEQYNLKHK